jgi:peptide/nickel transport system permease protein
MLKYILKRLLIFIPTLIAISLITFFLCLKSPGDIVEQKLNVGAGSEGQMTDKVDLEKSRRKVAEQLRLDLPIFYVSFSSSATPDSLTKIANQDHRSFLKRLISKYGNWDEISAYYLALVDLDVVRFKIGKTSENRDALIGFKESIQTLLETHEDKSVANLYGNIIRDMDQNPSFNIIRSEVMSCQRLYESMKDNATKWKTKIPSIKWHGWDSQYHRWLFGNAHWFGIGPNPKPEDRYYGFLRGDFGRSWRDENSVKSKIMDAVLRVTLPMALFSIILIYLISIPIGVRIAVKKGTLEDQATSTVLFILYSLPTFWAAGMLISTFGGAGLGWFPTYGIKSANLPADASSLTLFLDKTYHLILPIFCYVYGSLAFLSRQARGGMLTVLNQDYIRTARAKGLPESTVIWKHAFKNGLLPIITLFASIFPFLIGGTVVIEVVFSIPGMGKLAYEAATSKDVPTLITIVMFSSTLTLIGYLVADILYAVVDPRISYSAKK